MDETFVLFYFYLYFIEKINNKYVADGHAFPLDS